MLLPEVKLDQRRHWHYIEQAMESVITMPTGTAHYLSRGLEYRLAGKTGTAQVFSFGEDREESQKLMDKKKIFVTILGLWLMHRLKSQKLLWWFY